MYRNSLAKCLLVLLLFIATAAVATSDATAMPYGRPPGMRKPYYVGALTSAQKAAQITAIAELYESIGRQQEAQRIRAGIERLYGLNAVPNATP